MELLLHNVGLWYCAVYVCFEKEDHYNANKRDERWGQSSPSFRANEIMLEYFTKLPIQHTQVQVPYTLIVFTMQAYYFLRRALILISSEDEIEMPQVIMDVNDVVFLSLCSICHCVLPQCTC